MHAGCRFLTQPNQLSTQLCRFDRKAEPTADLSLPAGTSAAEALDRVLRLPSVCSKRFLTTKVGGLSRAVGKEGWAGSGVCRGANQ